MIRRTHGESPRSDSPSGPPLHDEPIDAELLRLDPTLAASRSGSARTRDARRLGGIPPRSPAPADLLAEFIHPDLIPLGAERDPSVDEGVSLESLFRQWGGAPIPSWRRRCPGGLAQLLDSFLSIARLLGELKGAGWTLTALHPRWFRLGIDGRCRLSASSLLEHPSAAGGESAPPIDQWAPYLAPELLLSGGDERAIGEEAGVYSLAAILHHCLAGSPPWSGRSETEVADRLLAEVPPTPIPTEKDLPRGVAPLLRDSLALDPRQRPARYRGFAAALESAANGGRPRSAPITGVETPKRSRFALRVVALILLLLGLISAFRGRALEEQRLDYLSRLEPVFVARPLPLHGEDGPTHPIAGQLLEEARSDARHWPRDPKVLTALGWVELRAGEFKRAQRAFLRALAWEPESVPARISLGIARLEGGDASGRFDLDRALAGVSTDELSQEETMFLGWGELYRHRFDRAVESFQSAIDREEQSFFAWFHLALAAHYDGDRALSAQALARASALQPHSIWVEWLAVERLAMAGESEAARKRIESRKSEWVESDALLLRGAVLLQRLGFEDRAQEWWRRIYGEDAPPLSRDHIRWTSRGLLVFPERVHLGLSD